ncbi:SRPBCC family protein [Halobium salinum]|uniref:SRPBCC family protein n=1 Tax=Halobium salinum TaxID=1364940 RepID=A0ABD5PCW2_9EURY|nr:SRPBCC domain-containing protein [Halobium salinum]
MREIRTDIEIDAPPRVVWEVLTDLDAYAEWNPQTTNASGAVREGERVAITVDRQGRRSASMRPRVVEADPERRLEWVATVLHPRLFEARHSFELDALDGDRTRVHNRERLSGVLVRFLVDEDAVRAYEAMNRALAARVASLVAESRTA